MSDMALLRDDDDNSVLFHPNIEREFAEKFTPGWRSVAVNAGTSALHLSRPTRGSNGYAIRLRRAGNFRREK